jgi:hypothetical protein
VRGEHAGQERCALKYLGLTFAPFSRKSRLERRGYEHRWWLITTPLLQIALG